MTAREAVNLELSPTERAIIDRARGAMDIRIFIRDAALVYSGVRLKTNGLPFEDGLDDLTPSEIVRLADEAEEDAVDMDEAFRLIDEHIAMYLIKIGPSLLL